MLVFSSYSSSQGTSRHLQKFKTCIFMSIHVQPQCSHSCVCPQSPAPERRQKRAEWWSVAKSLVPPSPTEAWKIISGRRMQTARLESGRANRNQTNLSVLQESPWQLEVRLSSLLSLGKSCSQKPALITLLAHGSHSAASHNGDLWSCPTAIIDWY